MPRWNYFTDDEVDGLDNEFVALLDRARHISGIPYVITDGFRTPKANTDPNAVSNSAHLKGMAADLRAKDGRSLGLILKGLYGVGLNRIGIYFFLKDGVPLPAHVHVDFDATKPQDVVWLDLEK